MRADRIRKMECSNCGCLARVTRGAYRFNESGLNNVILSGIDRVVCGKCGNIDPIIPSADDLMRVLALAIVAQPYRLGGKEVRFLRKYLGKTGQEFSSLLHVNTSTLSKWENNDDHVGPNNDRLIRTVTLGLDDSLQKELKWIINSFPKINERSTRSNNIEINTEKMSYQYA